MTLLNVDQSIAGISIRCELMKRAQRSSDAVIDGKLVRVAKASLPRRVTHMLLGEELIGAGGQLIYVSKAIAHRAINHSQPKVASPIADK